MDVKRWKVVIDSENCPHTSSINMCMLYETDINLSNEHLMDCTHENCPVKHIPRPDPAEAKRYENLIKFTCGILSEYNATPDEWEHFEMLTDDVKVYVPTTDTAEVERLVDEYVELIVDNTPVFTSDSRYIIKNILQQYRADLLKLVGG